MKLSIFFLFLPACSLGLKSTIDEEIDALGLDEADELSGPEDTQPEEALDIDGVYEAIGAFYIDVDAINVNDGSVLAADTCMGDLTIEINLQQEPNVFGRGDCLLEIFGIEGRGELTGNVDPYTGEITGSIHLILDTDPVEVSWYGSADGEMVDGSFEGSLPFSDANYNLDLDYLGEFAAAR